MRDDETVREVCDIIRIPRLDLFRTYNEIADRILASHEREIAAKDAEIARLKAALKPVMVLDCSVMKPIESWKLCGYNIEGDDELHIANFEIKDDAKWALACDHAVREAQRVMQEGGEK